MGSIDASKQKEKKKQNKTHVKHNDSTLFLLMQEINRLHKLDEYIWLALSGQVKSVATKNFVDHTALYRANQQIFYGSLRAWYDVDSIISAEDDWSPKELNYFYGLQTYLQKLSETSRRLSSLTYLFWQYDLGEYSEQNLRQRLNELYPPYANTHFQTAATLQELQCAI